MAHESVQSLRDELASIPGVAMIAIDADTRVLSILLRPAAAADDVRRQATTLAGDHFQVAIGFVEERRDRQRVRFVRVRRRPIPDGTVECTVVLEWDDAEYSGVEYAASGGVLELRAAALATINALAGILPPDVSLQLGGVKQTRAFDSDLLVVSVYRNTPRPVSHVGVVVIQDDPLRTAAVAVLNALNRVLGNFLSRP